MAIQRLLVTGASGFVGSHLVDAAREHGHTVRALVRATSRVEHLQAAGCELAVGDVGDIQALERAMDGVDAVIHGAGAVAAVDEASFARVNVFGARQVALAARTAGVRRFVLISSLAARGPSGDGEPGQGQVGEGQVGEGQLGHGQLEQRPLSPYGRSKLAGEQAVQSALGDALPCVIVRPTVVYGPRDRALLPLFVLANEGIRVELAGAGRLSLVHAADLAAGMIAHATHPGDGGTYEVSDGASYRFEQVVLAIAAAVGRPGATIEIPARLQSWAAKVIDNVRKVIPIATLFDGDKLRELRADWEARPEACWNGAGVVPRKLEEGLGSTVAAYRASGWLR